MVNEKNSWKPPNQKWQLIGAGAYKWREKNGALLIRKTVKLPLCLGYLLFAAFMDVRDWKFFIYFAAFGLLVSLWYRRSGIVVSRDGVRIGIGQRMVPVSTVKSISVISRQPNRMLPFEFTMVLVNTDDSREHVILKDLLHFSVEELVEVKKRIEAALGISGVS
jgi:hypothetical protein